MIIKNSKDMGHMVRNTRKDKKITQAQLAAAAGDGVRFIVDLESGKETIALNKALKVLTVLGLDTEVK